MNKREKKLPSRARRGRKEKKNVEISVKKKE